MKGPTANPVFNFLGNSIVRHTGPFEVYTILAVCLTSESWLWCLSLTQVRLWRPQHACQVLLVVGQAMIVMIQVTQIQRKLLQPVPTV